MDDARLRAYDGVAPEALAQAAGFAELEVYDLVSSTLDRAHLLGASQCASGTAVVAERQSAGRGRQGRTWQSEPGTGVWLSVIERPADTASVGVLSLRLGILLAEALAPFTESAIRLKWPNDLWTDAGKLAGILVEARWRGTTLEWVAIGVGVNVQPPRLEGATSGLSRDARRSDVLIAVGRAVRRAAQSSGLLSEAELAAWGARDLARGRAIVEPIVGTVRGVRSDGALLVQGSGGIQSLVTGSLRFAG